jgi:hypothetical protein
VFSKALVPERVSSAVAVLTDCELPTLFCRIFLFAARFFFRSQTPPVCPGIEIFASP